MIKRLYLLVCIVSSPFLGFSQDEKSEEDTVSNTVFTGDYLEMVSGDEISEFHLLGNVTVVGTKLNLTSDELHITAVKKGDKDATVTEMGKIMKILAIGNVKMQVEGRIAEAGRAELYPDEEKVLLTDNPIVTDAQGTISGEEIEWFHGQRKAQVRGGKKKVVVNLGAIPNLGYNPNAETQEEEPPADETEDAAEVESPNNP